MTDGRQNVINLPSYREMSFNWLLSDLKLKLSKDMEDLNNTVNNLALMNIHCTSNLKIRDDIIFSSTYKRYTKLTLK